MSVSYTVEHEEKILKNKTQTHTIDRTTLMMMKRERKFCIKTQTPGLMICNEIIETNSTAVACILYKHTHINVRKWKRKNQRHFVRAAVDADDDAAVCVDIFAL